MELTYDGRANALSKFYTSIGGGTSVATNFPLRLIVGRSNEWSGGSANIPIFNPAGIQADGTTDCDVIDAKTLAISASTDADKAFKIVVVKSDPSGTIEYNGDTYTAISTHGMTEAQVKSALLNGTYNPNHEFLLFIQFTLVPRDSTFSSYTFRKVGISGTSASLTNHVTQNLSAVLSDCLVYQNIPAQSVGQQDSITLKLILSF